MCRRSQRRHNQDTGEYRHKEFHGAKQKSSQPRNDARRWLTFPCEAVFNMEAKRNTAATVVDALTQIIKFFSTQKVTCNIGILSAYSLQTLPIRCFQQRLKHKCFPCHAATRISALHGELDF